MFSHKRTEYHSNRCEKSNILTSSHLILQRGRTILYQLLQWQCCVGQIQIQQTFHFLGMMKLQHTFIAIVLCANVVQENVNDFQQKLFRLRIGSHICWKNICELLIFSIIIIIIIIISVNIACIRFSFFGRLQAEL